MVSCALFTKNVMVMAALAMLANGYSIPGLKKRGDGVFKLDFEVVNKTVPTHTGELYANEEGFHFDKRDGSIPVSLIDNTNSYQVSFDLGSNLQPFKAIIDTGSSDLWIPKTGANCTSCAADGTYNPSASSSSKDVNQKFGFYYADNTSTSGEFYSDVLNIGGVTLNDFVFGVANVSTVASSGVFGIGFEQDESTSPVVSHHLNFTYPNLPQLLKEEGIIAKNAYSLYLNEYFATSGTILFGGIDHAKYNGTLATSKIAGYPVLSIDYKGIKTANGTTIPGSGKPIAFDSGTSTAGLPGYIIDNIRHELGASFVWRNPATGMDYYSANCDQGEKTFTFDFGDGTIDVPYTSFVRPLLPGLTALPCLVLPIYDTSEFRVDILGDIFLRSAYVVYDLDDRTISYANVVYTDESDITTI